MSTIPKSRLQRRTRRQHDLNILTDLEVWVYSDFEIISARSNVYIYDVLIKIREKVVARFNDSYNSTTTGLCESIIRLEESRLSTVAN